VNFGALYLKLQMMMMIWLEVAIFQQYAVAASLAFLPVVAQVLVQDGSGTPPEA
jgi:uncharacterized protein (DUF983 family)